MNTQPLHPTLPHPRRGTLDFGAPMPMVPAYPLDVFTDLGVTSQELA